MTKVRGKKEGKGKVREDGRRRQRGKRGKESERKEERGKRREKGKRGGRDQTLRLAEGIRYLLPKETVPRLLFLISVIFCTHNISDISLPSLCLVVKLLDSSYYDIRSF